MQRMNSHRRVILSLGACALAAPFELFAQVPKTWRVGFLSNRKLIKDESDEYYGPLRQGLRELGYVEGKNLVIEWRSSEGNSDRLPGLAVELSRMKIDAFATGGTPAALAAQKATKVIPIVMINVGDPLGTGLVASLARPGGNVTGFSNMVSELGPKLLELIRWVVPKSHRISVLLNPSNASNQALLKQVEAAARKIGVEVQSVEASNAEQISDGFASIARWKPGALIVSQDGVFSTWKGQIADAALKLKLPSIGSYSDYAKAGGLISYGQNVREPVRRAAVYLDKIFKGANPADLPVELPKQFDFSINLRTADSIGIRIPETLMVQATNLIR